MLTVKQEQFAWKLLVLAIWKFFLRKHPIKVDTIINHWTHVKTLKYIRLLHGGNMQVDAGINQCTLKSH